LKDMINQKEGKMNIVSESGNVHTLSQHARHKGTLLNPGSWASIKGLCGDEMKFFLLIEDEIIKEAKFETSGCFSSMACGETTAILAEGRSIYKAMAISAREVLQNLKDLPDDRTHCAILAVSTLYKAISKYLMKKDL